METLQRRLESLELYLNRPELAIICMRCKYALQPNGDRIARHLWEKHHVSPEHRKGIVTLIASLCLQDPNTLPLREDGAAPHPHLASRRGLACRGCKERTTSRDLMQRHLSKEHGCKSNRRTLLSDSIFNTVTLQSWTQNGSRESWIVDDSGDSHELDDSEDVSTVLIDPNSGHGLEETRRQAALTALHEAERRRATEDAHGPKPTCATPDDLALESNWMRRTSWATTFAGADRGLLSILDQTPARDGHHLELGIYGSEVLQSSIEDERGLAIVAHATDRFFERCEDTARHTDHSVRCWLRSQIPGRSYKAPFELPGRQRTRIAYRNLWKRMLFVYLRMYNLSDAARRTFLGITLADEQLDAIGQLWLAIRAHQSQVQGLHNDSSSHQAHQQRNATSNGRSPIRSRLQSQRAMRTSSCNGSLSLNGELRDDSDNSSSACEDEGDSVAEGDKSQIDPINDTDYDDNEEEDMGEELQLLLAARIDQPRGSTSEHERAKGQSEVFSIENDSLADAVGKISEFLCTEEFTDSRSSSTLLVYFSGLIGFPYPGDTFERPNNYTPKLSALIYCARLCLLEMSIPRYAHPSIGWEARPSRGALTMLNKVRERFMCLGCQSPMEELISLRSYGRAISRSDGPSFRVNWSEDSQEVSWDTGKEIGKLTMDQFRQLGRSSRANAATSLTRLMYGWTPTLRLTDIRDTLSNQKKGYSFVQDPMNNLSMAYLELSSRACLDMNQGLMRGDRWNMAAVHSYLEMEIQFLLDIMLVMYILGGQGPRSPELFSLEHQNGESTSRGVCVHDGSLVYIIRHAKARKATNNEFQVARYLGSKESRLLATYLIYVRPFTDMLCRVCLRHENGRRRLFASPNSPDTPWKVQMLTNALKALTKSVCGLSFGVQIYRQLSIAVTEKHVKQVSKPFNRYDDKTVAADIEVAYSWQSGHRPIQRGATYGIDGAFPDSLQPALLRVYRWASEEWQIFMNLGNVQGESRSTPRSQYGTKRYAVDTLDQRDTTRPRLEIPVPASSTPRQTTPSHPEAPLRSIEPCLPALSKPVVVTVHDQERPQSDHASGSDAWATVIQQRAQRAQARELTIDAQCKSQWHNDDRRAFELFAFLGKYKVIVCRDCQHAVWPMEVDSHLRGSKHKMLKHDRDRVQAEIRRWQGLIWNEDGLKLPLVLEEAIPELSVHDGYMCTIDQEICKAVWVSEERLRHHWRERHEGWTASGIPGRGGRAAQYIERGIMQQRIDKARCKVKCQRFFGSRRGSHYIPIIGAE